MYPELRMQRIFNPNQKQRENTMKITLTQLDAMARIMDDDKREQVHVELAPCEPKEFLTRYLELDPDFPVRDFGVEVEEV